MPSDKDGLRSFATRGSGCEKARKYGFMDAFFTMAESAKTQRFLPVSSTRHLSRVKDSLRRAAPGCAGLRPPLRRL